MPGPVVPGLKIGDVDPRFDPSAIHQISDKALSIGGAVLEAILVWMNESER
jgi:xanthine dehydrogenase accessory factor